MIGIIVAAHSNMARGLVDAAEMILGPQSRIEALAVAGGEGPDEIRQRFAAALERLDPTGEGVLILSDMFGGTPANIGLSFIDNARVEILTGVNLPMVLKACTARGGLSLEQLAVEVCEHAANSVVFASRLIKAKREAP